MLRDPEKGNIGKAGQIPSPRRSKNEIPLISPWLWLVIVLILGGGVTIFVVIVKNVMEDPMLSAFVPVPMAGGSPFSMGSLTELPNYNASDFTKVIHLPSVNALAVWRDSNGNDCLAARASEDIGFSEGQVAVVYDAPCNELARVSFKQVSWAANTNSIQVADVSGDGKPEVFAGVTGNNGDTLAVLDLDGSELFSTPYSDSSDHLIIAESPSQSQVTTLTIADGSMNGPPYRAFDMPTGAPNAVDASLFKSKVGEPDYFNCYSYTDWDGDGDRDYVFHASDRRTRDYSLAPYCDGQFLDKVPLTVTHFFEYNRYARYKDKNGDMCILAAGYDAVQDPKSNPMSGSYLGNSLKWYIIGKTSPQEKFYKSKRWCYGDEVWDIVDVTGDGVPEICALVVETRFVIVDLDGNELLNKEYFGKMRGSFGGLDSLVSGDFDHDDLNDIAFVYNNGIWIPDLGAVRGNASATGATTKDK